MRSIWFQDSKVEGYNFLSLLPTFHYSEVIQTRIMEAQSNTNRVQTIETILGFLPAQRWKLSNIDPVEGVREANLNNRSTKEAPTIATILGPRFKSGRVPFPLSFAHFPLKARGTSMNNDNESRNEGQAIQTVFGFTATHKWKLFYNMDPMGGCEGRKTLMYYLY